MLWTDQALQAPVLTLLQGESIQIVAASGQAWKIEPLGVLLQKNELPPASPHFILVPDAKMLRRYMPVPPPDISGLVNTLSADTEFLIPQFMVPQGPWHINETDVRCLWVKDAVLRTLAKRTSSLLVAVCLAATSEESGFPKYRFTADGLHAL